MNKSRKAIPLRIPVTWDFQEVLENPNKAVPAILTSSYIYYFCPEKRPICTDQDFDSICDVLKENYASVTHSHKRLISMDNLEAGSMYNLSAKDYPTMIIHCAVLMSDGLINKVPRCSHPELTKKRKNPCIKAKRVVRHGFLR